MKLVLLKETGLSIDNIPSQVIVMSSQCYNMSEGVLLVIDDNQFTNVKNCLALIRPLNYTTDDGPYVYVGNIVDDAQATNRPAHHVEIDDVVLAPPRRTFPADAMVEEMTERVQMAAREQTDNSPQERIIEEEKSPRIIQSIRNFPITPVPMEEFEIFMAQKMRNSLTSHANVAMENLIELNKLMGKAIILKNKINAITKNFISNEKIVEITKQIKVLQEEDNLIEKIEINKNNGWIHFTTKNIFTDKLADNTIRDIGRMLIMINMNILLAESLPSGEDGHYIKIINLTRQAENEEDAWECGHVLLDGSPCFGDGYDALYTALTKTDLIMAINIVIKFIKNPDIHDSWGKAALYFPEVIQ